MYPSLFVYLSHPHKNTNLNFTPTAQSRLWFHHIPRTLHRGEGSQGAHSHTRWQEDRSQACHPKESTSPGQQDQEDLRWRRLTGYFGRGGQGLLQPVRTRRGDGYVDGPADKAPPWLRICHLWEWGCGRSRMWDSLPHHQEQEGRVQEGTAQGSSHTGCPAPSEAHYVGHPRRPAAHSSWPADWSPWCRRGHHEPTGHASKSHTATAIPGSSRCRPAGRPHITEPISSTKRRCGSLDSQSGWLRQAADHISADCAAQRQVSKSAR